LFQNIFIRNIELESLKLVIYHRMKG